MQDILDSWAAKRSEISNMDEKQLAELIKLEIKGRARTTVVIPSHQRQSRLRTERERAALMARIEKKNGSRK